MVVYLDVILIENFIVNLFLLTITSQTVKVRLFMPYALTSAGLGSLYVITLLIPSLKYLTIFPCKLGVAFLMILIAFRKKNIVFQFKSMVIFIFYTMLLGGLCFYMDIGQGSGPLDFILKSFKYQYLLASIMIIYIFIYRIVVFVQDRKSMNTLIFYVDIMMDNYSKRIKAFLDTGNELREPATNLPVIIVEKEQMQDFVIRSKDKLFIPYQVIGGTKGNLEGFKPNAVVIHLGEKAYTAEAVVAFTDNKLSEYNDYQALLSRGIMQ